MEMIFIGSFLGSLVGCLACAALGIFGQAMLKLYNSRRLKRLTYEQRKLAAQLKEVAQDAHAE